MQDTIEECAGHLYCVAVIAEAPRFERIQKYSELSPRGANHLGAPFFG